MSRSLCFNTISDQICLQITPLDIFQTQSVAPRGNVQQLRAALSEIISTCNSLLVNNPRIDQQIIEHTRRRIERGRNEFEAAIISGDLNLAGDRAQLLREFCYQLL